MLSFNHVLCVIVIQLPFVPLQTFCSMRHCIYTWLPQDGSKWHWALFRSRGDCRLCSILHVSYHSGTSETGSWDFTRIMG